MLMDAVVITDCWWHLVQTRPKYGACARFFSVSLVLFLFLSMSTYHVLVGRRQWNRVFCLDTRCVRSVENYVPAADCATVRRHASWDCYTKDWYCLAARQYPETSMKRCEQDCCTRHVFMPEMQMIQISCEIMIDGWHDHLMIPSKLLMNMEFHCNLFKLYRTLRAEAKCLWTPYTHLFFRGLTSYCWYNPQPMRNDHSIAGTTILQTTLKDADDTQVYWW